MLSALCPAIPITAGQLSTRVNNLYGFFELAGMIVLHVVAVVVTQLREGGTLVSAMFSGRKIVPGKPVDAPDQATKMGP